MNKLTSAKRSAVVAVLVEGNSIWSTVLVTGVAENTVVKLLLELGEACSKFHDEKRLPAGMCGRRLRHGRRYSGPLGGLNPPGRGETS